MGTVGVDQIAKVEIAVAHMAYQEIRDARSFHLSDRVQQAVGQARDGHTGVGTHDAATGSTLEARKVGVVTRRPQACALFGGGGPFKRMTTKIVSDFLHCFCLLFHAGWRAMKLHQQHGLLGQSELGVGVDHAYRMGVDQLDTRNRNAHLDDLNGGEHRRFDRGK